MTHGINVGSKVGSSKYCFDIKFNKMSW